MPNAQRTTIVTGASQGIGAGLVEAFLNRGYQVVANSRNITKNKSISAFFQSRPSRWNIGNPGTAAKILDTAISRFGRVDVLVNKSDFWAAVCAAPGAHALEVSESSCAKKFAASSITTRIYSGAR